ncbi:hypothetical protein D9757_008204 [Collybiopsis confluens]|uniref:NAD-dependent epimerase/dehydratase domain-containing protein n=1 Tax=Collybiopsis confluens TaxID=2823264 RepID=A0A8H5M4C5_9AGAR|nr:hypothetical protein D9757_008204 [Collybiopsis confluens]
MSSQQQIIFLTGASGFLGSHILVQLLEKGFRVRAAVRKNKAAQFTLNYNRFGEQLEVIPITDIATDQVPESLKNVKALIHTAAPLPTRVADVEEQLKGAIEGALNIIRQAERAGVRRIVMTSSLSTARLRDTQSTQLTFTDKDWRKISMDEAKGTRGMEAYRAAKTLAEMEVWKFAESHPHVDITTFNPPIFYGPFTEGFEVAPLDYYALSTNLYIYRLLVPDGIYPPEPFHIDVRDIARAHVLALDSPPSSSVGQKRMVFGSPHDIVFEEMVDTISTNRPFLKDRLITRLVPKHAGKRVIYDAGRLEEVLGMKNSDFRQLKDTILDTGVTGVIHTAAPLSFRVQDAEGQIKGAVQGTLNVINQAEKAGIKNIVVTSTVLTSQTPQYTFTDQDWFDTSPDDALKTEGYAAYISAKTLAEKEVWSFAESHSDVEVTTINPPYLYGPYAEGFTIATGDYAALSTNVHLYKLLSPEGPFPGHPLYADVRDIAKAHILALSSQPTSKVGRKRMIISSPHDTDYAEVVKTIAENRPELKDRLTTSEPRMLLAITRLHYDQKRLEDVIGMKPSDFTPLNDTVLASVDAIISVEKQWAAEGFEAKVPL